MIVIEQRVGSMLSAYRPAHASHSAVSFSGLRHSREMTRVCSRKLTRRPASGGDDNGLYEPGAAWAGWVSLAERKWVISRERRGLRFGCTLGGNTTGRCLNISPDAPCSLPRGDISVVPFDSFFQRHAPLIFQVLLSLNGGHGRARCEPLRRAFQP